MSYSGYSASIPDTSPFKLYSQTSFGSDLKIGEPSHFQLNLCQQQQQFQMKQHLQQQHLQQHQKLQHSSSQQMQRLRVSCLAVWIALLLAAVVAALLAFTPLGLPVLPHQHNTWSSSSSRSSSSSSATHRHRSAAMAPTAGTIKCHVQQGSSSTSSLCDGKVQYVDGRQAHITIWRQSAVSGGLSQPGLQDAAVRMDDGTLPAGAAAWDAASVFGRRRKQQHRKLVRFA